jgi:quercetin dioxygenase-like cupin family protein
MSKGERRGHQNQLSFEIAKTFGMNKGMGSNSVIRTALGALSDILDLQESQDAADTAGSLRSAPHEALSIARRPSLHDSAVRALLLSSKHPAAAAILSAQVHIPWGPNPVSERVPLEIAQLWEVASLLGPEGPLYSSQFRVGLFYQRPDTYYPLHSHNAVETYTIVAGSALWTVGQDTETREAGDMIHHPSLVPHAFRTGSEGFVALWRWSGDISVASYRMLDDAQALLSQ